VRNGKATGHDAHKKSLVKTHVNKNFFVLIEDMTSLFQTTFVYWFQIWYSFSSGTSNFGAKWNAFWYTTSCTLIC